MEKKFKAISDFVTDLNLIFPKDKPVAIYVKLLEKHKDNPVNIEKHCKLFKDWISLNLENIKNKDKNFHGDSRIIYSENVFIDLKKILNNVVSEDEQAIWQHLLTINYLLFPTDFHKKILKETLDAKKLIPTDTNEGKLIENALEKVTANIGNSGSEDPGAIMTNLLSSGAIGDIMASMSSGNIDPKKLIGIAQNMLNTLSEKIE